MTSKLKEKMRRGEVAIAVNIGGHNADIIEPLARLGADVAFIDCERTGIGLDAATDLIRASRAAGLPCVVRSWSKAPEVLVRYLDRKVDGIVVPHVDSAEEAAATVELVRYACGDAAANKLVVVQIETKAAVKQAGAMAAVPGVDVILIGPNDLSAARAPPMSSRPSPKWRRTCARRAGPLACPGGSPTLRPSAPLARPFCTIRSSGCSSARWKSSNAR